MWPFNRVKPPTLAERAALKPPVPCGQQVAHYEWEWDMGMSCPMCAGQKARAKKDADDQRMADRIATAVVKRLREVA